MDPRAQTAIFRNQDSATSRAGCQANCVVTFDRADKNGYNVGTTNNEVSAVAFDQQKYITDYVRNNYDQVMVKVPKGKKAILKQLATDNNITDDKGKISVNRMIIEAVEEKYKVDLSKPN